MEEKKNNHCNQLVMVLKYKDFKINDGEPEETYAVIIWCKVEEEGPSDVFLIQTMWIGEQVHFWGSIRSSSDCGTNEDNRI